MPSNDFRSTERLFPIRHLRDRHRRKRGKSTGAGVHFQDHGAEQPLPDRIAAHRPREVGRIGGGERLGKGIGTMSGRLRLPVRLSSLRRVTAACRPWPEAGASNSKASRNAKSASRRDLRSRRRPLSETLDHSDQPVAGGQVAYPDRRSHAGRQHSRPPGTQRPLYRAARRIDAQEAGPQGRCE